MRKAKCTRCFKLGWVNDVTIPVAIPVARMEQPIREEWCSECFESAFPWSPKLACSRTSSGSGKNHNDPGFDNIVRAFEEDR
jgi:hypothetical protein